MVDLALKPAAKDISTAIDKQPVVQKENILSLLIKFGTPVYGSLSVFPDTPSTETSTFADSLSMDDDEVIFVTSINLSVSSNSSAYINPRVYKNIDSVINYLLDMFLVTGTTYPQSMTQNICPSIPIIIKKNETLNLACEGGTLGDVYAIANINGYRIKLSYIQNLT